MLWPLSYTAKSLPIANCRLPIRPWTLDYWHNQKLAIDNRQWIGWSDGAQTRTSRLKRPLLCHSSSGPKHCRFLIADCRLVGWETWTLSFDFRLSTQSTIGNRQSSVFWLWRKDSNLRMAALTVRCLTNLATPQKRSFSVYHWTFLICHLVLCAFVLCSWFFVPSAFAWIQVPRFLKWQMRNVQ